MVRGIEKFREYFKAFADSYVIIGGTACDIILEDAGFTPRATKDFDIILVVEALEPEFVQQFWTFIKDGNYGQKEKSPEERKYYRFLHPENTAFPKQVELFSRIPDLLDLDEDTHLTPIPVDDDLSSLSAILLDEDYYNYTLQHSMVEDGVHIASIEALICLKAKAFLDMSMRKADGEKIDEKNIRKHKTDVFRMAVMHTAENVFELPESNQKDLQSFADTIKDELPGQAMFKEMGLGNMASEKVFQQLLKNFQLNGE
jgi:hypothetical protein